MIDWTEVIIAILGLIITGVLVPWINSKTKNEKYHKIVSEIGNVVAGAVDSVGKTYVDDLKRSGVMTDAQKAKALSDAMQLTMNNLSKQAISYFHSNEIDIDTYVKTQIEAYLKRGEK